MAKKKILITEDDVFIANAYKQGLEDEGFTVGIAHDGDEAITKLKQEEHDLMLLDLVMAGKDGFSVLEEIQNTPEISNVPVIILSNLGEASDIERGKHLGAIDYIVKSDHSLSEVIDKVKENCSKK